MTEFTIRYSLKTWDDKPVKNEYGDEKMYSLLSEEHKNRYFINPHYYWEDILVQIK